MGKAIDDPRVQEAYKDYIGALDSEREALGNLQTAIQGYESAIKDLEAETSFIDGNNSFGRILGMGGLAVATAAAIAGTGGVAGMFLAAGAMAYNEIDQAGDIESAAERVQQAGLMARMALNTAMDAHDNFVRSGEELSEALNSWVEEQQELDPDGDEASDGDSTSPGGSSGTNLHDLDTGNGSDQRGYEPAPDEPSVNGYDNDGDGWADESRLEPEPNATQPNQNDSGNQPGYEPDPDEPSVNGYDNDGDGWADESRLEPEPNAARPGSAEDTNVQDPYQPALDEPTANGYDSWGDSSTGGGWGGGIDGGKSDGGESDGGGDEDAGWGDSDG